MARSSGSVQESLWRNESASVPYSVYVRLAGGWILLVALAVVGIFRETSHVASSAMPMIKLMEVIRGVVYLLKPIHQESSH